MDLRGKTAIVTGASRGIGKGIALTLAAYGAQIVMFGAPTAHAEETKTLILQKGVECIAVGGDVRNMNDCENLVKNSIDKFGKIDIVVNNAGIIKDNLLMRMGENDWNDVLDINLKGPFNIIKAVTRPMFKARSGSIINVSSVVGMMGNAGQANYVASKAGLIGLTKSVAKEFAPRGITCNAVAPGFIRTEMTDQLPEPVKEEYLKNIPLARFGEALDVAQAVAFLAGDGARYITGQVIQIDGGLLM